MQDFYLITEASSSSPAFFGVFDGHGGIESAKFVKETLRGSIGELLPPQLTVNNNNNLEEKKLVAKAIVEGFRATDAALLKEAKVKGWNDGCTALVALVVNDSLHLANLGDSKAVLVRRNNVVKRQKLDDTESSSKAPADEATTAAAASAQREYKMMQLSKDHNPMDWEERKRIQKAGVFEPDSDFFLNLRPVD